MIMRMNEGEIGELFGAFICLMYRIKLKFRMNLRARMNLWPKLHMLPGLFWLFRPLFILWQKKIKKERKKMNRPLLDLSASPQVKTPRSSCLLCRTSKCKIPQLKMIPGKREKASSPKIRTKEELRRMRGRCRVGYELMRISPLDTRNLRPQYLAHPPSVFARLSLASISAARRPRPPAPAASVGPRLPKFLRDATTSESFSIAHMRPLRPAPYASNAMPFPTLRRGSKVYNGVAARGLCLNNGAHLDMQRLCYVLRSSLLSAL